MKNFGNCQHCHSVGLWACNSLWVEGKISVRKCDICGCELDKEDALSEEGKTLCEDCYIEGHHRIQTCDPWAVRSKKIFRKEAGLKGTEGLTELQRAIY